ncbi:thiamine biosynthesis protein [Candidatus Nitrosotalea okcheonensis]|uniref:Thiamine biosynthesis ATP pyrophosphatase-like protein n=1 Tax=Candidatus Nitrosotalea okcheonensis TaxID=1903276 RepID=A0A2H1FHB6_9ARCH|nr:thiamine biosynthesis protein [Candidatus Nitrosotalea okcheonensis]SMH72134.1 Thiamine biosynthesis ATP pyrophosphatase-like protein [Candidatus Nitrosotalea okcheonensis]
MLEKTVLVIFPSIYSLNKINNLAANISKILKIKNQHHSGIRKNESLIIVEAVDPVLASSAVNLLFGIDKIAIAKEVDNNFDSVLSAITNTALSLLLKGEKFYVKVEGKTEKFLAKDLEVASTAMLVEKSMHLEAKPGSESDHDRLVYAYLTDAYAYVCIFVDSGLSGIPYNSQREKILCCIYDELSAIACLQTIKMGFEVKILICYHNESDLLKLAKIVNKMLPRIIEKNTVLHICKMDRSPGIPTTITVITQVMISIASREKIGRISLGISPMIFPASFCEYNANLAFQNKIIPWFSLSGIDSGILENAKEIGLEKYIANLEDLCKKHSNYKKIPMSQISKHAKSVLKTIKSIQVTTGPKNIHDIIDSLKSNH